MPVSTVERSVSATRMHVSPLFWTSCPFRSAQSTERGSLCPQWVLSSYLFYARVWVHMLTQSHLTLCSSMGCTMPGSSVYGVLQARTLEWFAISFSRWSSPPRDHTLVPYVSCIGRQILYHWATWEAQQSSRYMSVPISKSILPPPFPSLVFTCVFLTSVSLFLLCQKVPLYHFSQVAHW